MDIAVNKRARYDYEFLETLEVGIELAGHEVKSAKRGHAKLTGSFVHIRNGEAWLTNASIAKYAKAATVQEYEPTRSRRLLLAKRDINHLIGKQQTDRCTIIPIRMYVKRGLIKLEIAVARGKRKYEKREIIKKRDDERRMRSARMR
ncbi:MAG: SsrA-binding protein SmpB [Candidatus Uhrbacteria bacterium]